MEHHFGCEIKQKQQALHTYTAYNYQQAENEQRRKQKTKTNENVWSAHLMLTLQLGHIYAFCLINVFSDSYTNWFCFCQFNTISFYFNYFIFIITLAHDINKLNEI